MATSKRKAPGRLAKSMTKKGGQRGLALRKRAWGSQRAKRALAKD